MFQRALILLDILICQSFIPLEDINEWIQLVTILLYVKLHQVMQQICICLAIPAILSFYW
jgi:hypothetical protein